MSLRENYFVSFHCSPHSLIIATFSKRTGHTNPIWLPVVKKDYSARGGAPKGDSWMEVSGSWICKRPFDSPTMLFGFQLGLVAVNHGSWHTLAYGVTSHYAQGTALVSDFVFINPPGIKDLPGQKSLSCIFRCTFWVGFNPYAYGSESWMSHVESDFKRLMNIILNIYIPALWPQRV